MLFADFPNSKFWFPEFFSSYAWHVTVSNNLPPCSLLISSDVNTSKPSMEDKGKTDQQDTFYTHLFLLLTSKSILYEFQQCGILTSVDSDEPVQPPFKLRNSK